MQFDPRASMRRLARGLAAAGLLSAASLLPGAGAGAGAAPQPTFDPLLDTAGRACGPVFNAPPALLQALVRVKAGSTGAAATADAPRLYPDLGRLSLRIETRSPQAQAWFNQGLRLAYGFNHAEARRAFQVAQKLDPQCAMCFWGEALILGPNINVPMMPEAQAPAWAALQKAVALKAQAGDRNRALIEALETRYSSDPNADRAAHDARYADAMKAIAARFPSDDNLLTLAAEAAMDTQPWDYWEAGGAKPKGRGAYIVETLETVLARSPNHPGAIHLYIHAMEASTEPEKALPAARRLAALAPGAGHLVHMPAHIYYRLGLYRESLLANQRAVRVDEGYFKTSPSDPIYKAAYYPHNLHFVMVSALMGGEAATALDAAARLDAAMPADVVRAFAIMQPIKGAPYAAHAVFSDAKTVLALPAPPEDLVVVRAMYHYARAVAQAAARDFAGAESDIAALARLASSADFKPFEPWGVPAKAIVQTAQHVAQGRLADARGDLDGAAKAYESAITSEDSLSYTEPPYWYYPVRQSLASVRLRQGRLDDARDALRESLVKVRNNGWALAALAEVERRRGDAGAERAARAAMARAWFGAKAGPDLSRI
jgi:tetratricopeptide (TPR) repeat protein